MTGHLPEMGGHAGLEYAVDKAELEEFDEITLIFNEQSGSSSTVSFKYGLINNDQILWDDRIWEVISP